MSYRNYRDYERGEGRVKLLFALFLITTAAYVGMQFLPVYLHSLQMQDATKEVVRIAALQNLREADVRARLVEKAVECNLPDDVRIDILRSGKRVVAQVVYTQVITLPGYTYAWPFRIREEETGF